MNFISKNLYKKVVNHAMLEGLPKAALSSLLIPKDSLRGVGAVPADLFFELHEKIDQALNPGFSIRVGGAMEMDDYGILGLSWKTCSQAREIFERSERYFTLLSNTYLFKVHDEKDLTKIYLKRENYRPGVALSNQSTFAATVVVLKAITATDIRPVEVSFKHPAPREQDIILQYFDCPVYFNQPANFIGYHRTDLDLQTAKADTSINQYLLDRIAEETQGVQISSNKLLSQVKSLIRDALPSGIPNKTKVGKHLGLSNRTLTRRLSQTGYTFREIVVGTQKEISQELLLNSSQSVSEIAFQAGFSEQSAFNRAFKRWTGQSPSSFRKK